MDILSLVKALVDTSNEEVGSGTGSLTDSLSKGLEELDRLNANLEVIGTNLESLGANLEVLIDIGKDLREMVAPWAGYRVKE